jgi:hypothetical protein
LPYQTKKTTDMKKYIIIIISVFFTLCIYGQNIPQSSLISTEKAHEKVAYYYSESEDGARLNICLVTLQSSTLLKEINQEATSKRHSRNLYKKESTSQRNHRKSF